ncbi:RES family NAD+ phosphorylase [Vibrio sp.]|nr:RES family NAD+ phosphorylase [Vibrio sp.]
MTEVKDILVQLTLPFYCHTSVARIVETQEESATLGLVNGDFAKQDLLESVLDECKPPYAEGTEEQHYLLSTPFRYPPLKYGSRFGSTSMPSYFYASEKINTVLAECAFYRLAFRADMVIPYEGNTTSEHMTFQIEIKTNNLADLTTIQQSDINDALRSPTNYSLTQDLGKVLIEEWGIEVIRFWSARCEGINVAVASPAVFVQEAPFDRHYWICTTSNTQVQFKKKNLDYQNNRQFPVSFSITEFMIDGQLPNLA